MIFGNLLRKVLRKLLPNNSIEKELKVQIAVSGIMENAMELWSLMYENNPPWQGGPSKVIPINLPAAIAEEFSRLVLTEFEISVTGSPMAEFVNQELIANLDEISRFMELYCAKGGIVIKPYVTEPDENGIPTSISLDFVQADNFYPVSFNSSGEVAAAVFVQSKKIGSYMYTRLEYHELVGTTYTITNKAYRSEEIAPFQDGGTYEVRDRFREQISLKEVDEWASLSETPVVIQNLKHPLFVYIKVPKANNLDTGSPLGVSVYSRAVDIIKQADIQYGRVLWEYEAMEAGILADDSLFKTDRKGRPVIPVGQERTFKTFSFDGGQGGGLLEPFAPAIRDDSLFNGLNKHLMRIEFLCGLAYGTLSEPQSVERTATEIKFSKQRSYHTVAAMQKAWDRGFQQLAEAMRIFAVLYQMVPDGEMNVSCTWGDGILEDTDTEYERRWSMVLSGKLKPEKFIAWYFGCTEEEAAEYIPNHEVFPPEE